MADAQQQNQIYRASTTAPVNIAVVKYWGKRNPTLNLPTNSSLSVTLSQSDLRTHTTASCSALYKTSPDGQQENQRQEKQEQEDTLLLNDAPSPLTTPRSLACLRTLRQHRRTLESTDPSLPKLSTYPLRLVSRNNFPTAAGLASSAAGFAALIRAIANLYALPQSPAELSLVARQGSGSACRSLLGGFVAWDAGVREDGSDSGARVVAERAHWPDLRACILVVSAEQKAVSSTEGMQRTVGTSELFRRRVGTVVPWAMDQMEIAILERDFDTFARVTMRESNSFHATCLDTAPPIFYLNDVSGAAIRVVEGINALAEARGHGLVAAYTFDAGPNAVIYYLERDREVVRGSLRRVLGEKEGWVGRGEDGGGVVEQAGDASNSAMAGPAVLGKGYESAESILRNGVARVIETSIGDGPISVDDHLVDEKGDAVMGDVR